MHSVKHGSEINITTHYPYLNLQVMVGWVCRERVAHLAWGTALSLWSPTRAQGALEGLHSSVAVSVGDEEEGEAGADL
jgi:hypothetical protein